MRRYNISGWGIGVIIYCLVSLLSACEQGPDFRTFSFPKPTITSVSPGVGYPTSKVEINGAQFGNVTGPVTVWFNGVKADSVLSCTDGQIIVKVPPTAVSGKMSLKIWNYSFDSIAAFNVLSMPVIDSLVSKSALGKNIALPGDTLVFYGTGFGTSQSALTAKLGGAAAKVLTPVTDKMFKVVAPEQFATGNATVELGGISLTAPVAIINPTAAGDITPYFMSNTGNITSGGGFKASLASGRWGVLAAPWVTSAGAMNKTNGTIGGWSKDGNGVLCWETWGNTPVIDGVIYQPTRMELPAGSYTVTFKYYSEIQQNSSMYLEVATGVGGIPKLADIPSALASVALASPAVIGTTKPNITETKSVNFTLAKSQFVSIGFLGNIAWGNGSADPGNYVTVNWIQLVKN